MGVKIRERDGAFWIFVDHQGQRKARRVGVGKQGKKAAELAAIQIQAKLASGEAWESAPAAKKVPTFATLAEEWLTSYPQLHEIRPGTLENYRAFISKHLLPAFGTRSVTELTWQVIEDFISAKRLPGGSVRRSGKGLSDVTVRNGIVVLRMILQRAVRLGHLPANPMSQVEWRGQSPIEDVDPFTTAELQAILTTAHAVDPDLATLLRLWAQSGMREGEVLGLHPEDIDLTTGRVLVRRTLSRGRVGPTKTGRERHVSFLHPVAENTAEWRPGVTTSSRDVLDGLRRLKVQPADPTGYLFLHAGRPWTQRDMARHWQRVLTKAGVRYRNPEQLRHTLASTLLSRNAPLLYVQQQGGWRTAGVLLKFYAKWLPQEGFSQPYPDVSPAQSARQGD